ncbi:MAG: DUF4381 family protein [Deltaproteobacteria bacterium]|nr:DUF4381 family protein [Deltaproteobacteria bacterium]
MMKVDMYNNLNKRILLTGAVLLLLISSLVLIISCSKPGKQGASAVKEEAAGIHETYENGPASLTLDADKSSMTIAERLNLTIRVIVDEEYEVTMPDLTGRLEQFGIVDWHTTQPELLDNNKKRITRTYVLEPFLSGDYTIPPMEAQFYKESVGDADTHSISTSELTVKVNSLLPEDIKEMKLHDIRPPVPYPTDYRKWILIAGGVLLLTAAGIFAWFYYKRRARTVDAHAVMLTPHEIAYRELDELASEGLAEKGEIKPYYQRVSGILRRYIENRFGLRAPEQTTEEFLAGLDRSSGLPENFKPLLRTFLRHCDLVKFAEFMPGQEESLRAFESCRDFIRGTEEKERV